MNKIVKNSWALFLGMSMIMLSYGYQSSLLGVRAVVENFSLASTGFMMSGYFVGYFIGARTATPVISSVGHIRVFAAFASIASLSILLHSIFVNPLSWFLLRVVTGYSMVLIYTIAESWLNDRASNKNRGKVLSIYMIILYGSMGLGMFLLNFSKPENFEPFILISAIMSLALIPILLTKRKAPTFKKISTMSIKDLYNSSPLGTVGALLLGTVHSAVFLFFAVYAAELLPVWFLEFFECTKIGCVSPLAAPLSIITSSTFSSLGRSNIVLRRILSNIDLNPLAPVFLLIALFAISLSAPSLKFNLTPSNLNNS